MPNGGSDNCGECAFNQANALGTNPLEDSNNSARTDTMCSGGRRRIAVKSWGTITSGLGSYPPESEVAAIGKLAEFGEYLKYKKGSIPSDAFEFPLEDIIHSLLDERLQKKHRGDDPQSKYDGNVQNLEKESVWFYFKSPAGTWKNLRGRARWMVASRRQLRQLAFFCEVMG